MKTPHQDFQKAKEELIDLLKHHEAVLAFQEAEKAIGQIPQISYLAGQMKAYQQEAVLFQLRNNVPMRRLVSRQI